MIWLITFIFQTQYLLARSRLVLSTVPHSKLCLLIIIVSTALQRNCTENSKKIFPEMKLSGLVPNSYILHSCICERFICIFPRLVRCSIIDGSRVKIHIYKLFTDSNECGNWEVSFLGIHTSDLVCSVVNTKIVIIKCFHLKVQTTWAWLK